MISALMDNEDIFNINMCIQVGDGDLHLVTMENHNDIIKGIFNYLIRKPVKMSAEYD